MTITRQQVTALLDSGSFMSLAKHNLVPVGLVDYKRQEKILCVRVDEWLYPSEDVTAVIEEQSYLLTVDGVECLKVDVVQKYCSTCPTYQKTFITQRSDRAFLQPLPTISTPFHIIAMDIVGPLYQWAHNATSTSLLCVTMPHTSLRVLPLPKATWGTIFPGDKGPAGEISGESWGQPAGCPAKAEDMVWCKRKAPWIFSWPEGVSVTSISLQQTINQSARPVCDSWKNGARYLRGSSL